MEPPLNIRHFLKKKPVRGEAVFLEKRRNQRGEISLRDEKV